MSVEKIVRPFQSPNVFSARVLAPDQPGGDETPEPGVLEWQGKADSKYVEEPPPGVLGFQSQWEEDKSRRVTEQVRVENPNDPEQFVMVERIKQAVFKNRSSGEELPIKLDW